MVYIRLPSVCPRCQAPKAYWKPLNQPMAKLSELSLRHLSNLARVLGARAELAPSGQARAEIEIALDLIYAEIGSRADEIQQDAGIHAALQRSLGKA
jgi:hypothetical protein